MLILMSVNIEGMCGRCDEYWGRAGQPSPGRFTPVLPTAWVLCPLRLWGCSRVCGTQGRHTGAALSDAVQAGKSHLTQKALQIDRSTFHISKGSMACSGANLKEGFGFRGNATLACPDSQ